MSLPSDLDSIIAPSPETEATIPVSIVFSLIAEKQVPEHSYLISSNPRIADQRYLHKDQIVYAHLEYQKFPVD